MSKQPLCNQIKPEFCLKYKIDEKKYCDKIKTGIGKGNCSKIYGGPILDIPVPYEHLINPPSRTATNTNMEAALSASRLEAKRTEDEQRKAFAQFEAAAKAKVEAAARAKLEAAAKAKLEAAAKAKSKNSPYGSNDNNNNANFKKALAASLANSNYSGSNDNNANFKKALAASLANSNANSKRKGYEHNANYVPESNDDENTHPTGISGALEANRAKCVAINRHTYDIELENSCYMDSLMFSLFSFPNDFVNKYLLRPDFDRIRAYIFNDLHKKYVRKNLNTIAGEIPGETSDAQLVRVNAILRQPLSRPIETQLRTDTDKIMRYIRSVHRMLVGIHQDLTQTRDKQICRNLRGLLLTSPFQILEENPKKFAEYNENVGTFGQDDPALFFNAILETFCVENLRYDNHRSYSSTSSNSHKESVVTEMINPIINFQLGELTQSRILVLDKQNPLGVIDHTNTNTGVTYNRVQESQVYREPVEDADKFIAIPINRLTGEYNADTNEFVQIKNRAAVEIAPELKFNRGSATTLTLNQIIVHEGGGGGGHYVVYFRCNDYWYLYNDNPGGASKGQTSTITRIGTFTQLLKNTSVKKDAHMLIYSNSEQIV